MTGEIHLHHGQFIATLREGDRVMEHYRVLRKSVKTSRAGDPYLDLDVGDRTGRITARMFKPRQAVGDPIQSFASLFQVGDAIRVSGRIDLFQGRLQMILDKIRLSSPEEVDDALFEKASPRPPEEMEKELRETIERIADPMLRRMMEEIFGDEEFAARFASAPAATRLHHAYRRGLMEHTLSLVAAAELLLPHYPELNPDLVRVGLLLHDMGKTEELGEKAGEEYTVDGTLLGHVYIGARRAERAMERIEGFPEEHRRQVLHLVLSHHGEREFGAPVLPATREAIFVYHLDNLDAKLANARETLDADRNEQSAFTDLFSSGAVKRRYYKSSLPEERSGDA